MRTINPTHVAVSRNDAVGDVVLALPVCGLIKEHYPSCKVSFLGRTYTRDMAMASNFIDNFINQDDLDAMTSAEVSQYLQKQEIDTIIFLKPDKKLASRAKDAGIRWRVGTRNRIFHWFTCNRLVKLSRKNSALHEAQLNLKLLKGINIDHPLSKEELPRYYGLSKLEALASEHQQILNKEKFNLIIHPKSHGNSLEWSLQNFAELISRLDKTRFRIFITGSKKESGILKPWISSLGDQVTDLSGELSLKQFISFINAADGLIAASTGPIHIAAATGIHALGLYTDIRTKEAHRWGPLGAKAQFLQCVNADMDTITVDAVYKITAAWLR